MQSAVCLTMTVILLAHLFFAELGVRYDEGNINNVVESQHRNISWETQKRGGHGIPNAIVP